MISVALTMALMMPVLLTTTEIAHAAENRYGMAAAPPHTVTMVALTAYSSDDEPAVLTATRMGRVVASETGTMTVAYDMGAFHALDGPEKVLVGTAIANVVVTTQGVRWMEFPANVDTEPPLAIPSPAERSPVAVCYGIRRWDPSRRRWSRRRMRSARSVW